MAEYVQYRDALGDPELEALRGACLGSRFVSGTTLKGMFQGSRGFAFIFTEEGRATLEQRFPFLSGYLERVMDPGSWRRLRPWRERLRGGGPQRRPNAFYLNLLLLEEGQGVGRHVDATLQGPSGVEGARPELVSVLYLQVPERVRGGALRLSREAWPVGKVRPRTGLLVHFRGNLRHEVEPFTGGEPGALRASLVCEQYVFEPQALARLPTFRIQSKAGFTAYLEEHRARAAVP